MLKRMKVIKILCKRYKINAAEANETYSIVLENKLYKTKQELHAELDMYEELGKE